MARNRAARELAAKRDIRELAEFIFRDSPPSAVRFMTAVRSTIKRLAEMPGLGAVYESEISSLRDLRVFPVKGFDHHLIFYRPARTGIRVVGVIHASRDLEKALRQAGKRSR